MKESSVVATGPPAYGHDAIADNRAVDAARNLLRTLIFYDLFDVPLRLNESADRTFEGLPDSWRADPLAMIQSDVCLSRYVVIAKQYVFLQTTRPEFNPGKRVAMYSARGLKIFSRLASATGRKNSSIQNRVDSDAV